MTSLETAFHFISLQNTWNQDSHLTTQSIWLSLKSLSDPVTSIVCLSFNGTCEGTFKAAQFWNREDQTRSSCTIKWWNILSNCFNSIGFSLVRTSRERIFHFGRVCLSWKTITYIRAEKTRPVRQNISGQYRHTYEQRENKQATDIFLLTSRRFTLTVSLLALLFHCTTSPNKRYQTHQNCQLWLGVVLISLFPKSCYAYYIFWTNQWKIYFKIFSWTQCEISCNWHIRLATMEFSLNVFTEFIEFSGKNNIILKRLLYSNSNLNSCVRNRDSTTVLQRHS